MTKLTDKTIRDLACPIGMTERVFFDEELHGFGLRIRASGVRSWLAQYAIAGRTRKVTLGSPPLVTAGAARVKAAEILAAVRLGSDPAKEKAKAREDADRTVGALIPAWLEKAEKVLQPKTFAERKCHLTRYAKRLHGHPVAKVERREIAELLDIVTREHGPGASNKVRIALSSFFDWVAHKGLLDVNPVSMTEKAIEGGARDRALTDAELTAVWQALELHVSVDYRDIVRLLILTGLRRSEVSDLRWSEINLGAKLMTIPGARTKTGKEHVVPLSAQALEILAGRMRTVGRDLVFGAGDRKGYEAFSASKRALDAQLGDRVAAWVLHDLRRTISTGLNGAAFPTVQPHVVEAILGHVIPGIAGVYNKQKYETERAEALDLWGAHVERLVTGISELRVAA